MPNYTLQAMWLVSARQNENKMSKGFINVSTSHSGDISYYLREGECIGYYHKDSIISKEEILSAWKTIGKNEIEGNKSLGIRGRHDAQVRKNYTLSMPNSLSAKDCIEKIKSLVIQTPIKDCTYTIAVHKGEKDGIENRHVHLLVNERNVHTMKKDREMINKVFLEKSFSPLYEKTFESEFSKGRAVEKRERIDVGLYSADPSKARRGIVAYQRTADFYRRQEQERRAFEERRNREQTERQERLEKVAQQIQAWEKSKAISEPKKDVAQQEVAPVEEVSTARQKAIAAAEFLMKHEKELRQVQEELAKERAEASKPTRVLDRIEDLENIRTRNRGQDLNRNL